MRRRILGATVGEYRKAMLTLAASPSMSVWYHHLEVDRLLAELRREVHAKELAPIDAEIAKARTKDSMRALSKLTAVVDGERRIVSDPPLIVSIEELVEGDDWHEIDDEIRAMVERYRGR